MINENGTTTYTIETAATVNRAITVTVDYNFDLVELLDIEPTEDINDTFAKLGLTFDGIGKNFELLDVEFASGQTPVISKLYKTPANDTYAEGFTFIYTYNFNTREEDILLPKDFEESAFVQDFDDLRTNHILDFRTINEWLIW